MARKYTPRFIFQSHPWTAHECLGCLSPGPFLEVIRKSSWVPTISIPHDPCTQTHQNQIKPESLSPPISATPNHSAEKFSHLWNCWCGHQVPTAGLEEFLAGDILSQIYLLTSWSHFLREKTPAWTCAMRLVGFVSSEFSSPYISLQFGMWCPLSPHPPSHAHHALRCLIPKIKGRRTVANPVSL